MNKPFSYRDDPSLPDFEDSKPVLFYDGVCVLCSGFVQFILKHDTSAQIRFAAVQSALGTAIYKHYGLSTDPYETNLFLLNGDPNIKSASFLSAMSVIGYPWKILSLGNVIPGFIRDPLYELIARNRYRIFGKHETCLISLAGYEDRFVA